MTSERRPARRPWRQAGVTLVLLAAGLGLLGVMVWSLRQSGPLSTEDVCLTPRGRVRDCDDARARALAEAPWWYAPLVAVPGLLASWYAARRAQRWRRERLARRPTPQQLDLGRTGVTGPTREP